MDNQSHEGVAVSQNFRIICGVDLVDVPKMARSVELLGEAFLERAFTATEIARCANNIPRLAAFFAVKEAVTKALGTGLRGIDLPDIEVDDEHERPIIRLLGAAAAQADSLHVVSWSLSLSYDRRLAIANVVAQCRADA